MRESMRESSNAGAAGRRSTSGAGGGAGHTTESWTAAGCAGEDEGQQGILHGAGFSGGDGRGLCGVRATEGNGVRSVVSSPNRAQLLAHVHHWERKSLEGFLQRRLRQSHAATPRASCVRPVRRADVEEYFEAKKGALHVRQLRSLSRVLSLARSLSPGVSAAGVWGVSTRRSRLTQTRL